MRIRTLALVAALGLALSLGGCGGADDGGATEGKPDETGDADDKTAFGKADAWNSRNNPNGLQVQLNYKWADLNKDEYRVGESDNKPWPDTYWPTYMDSTNVRWQGADVLSPLEKYDAAFHDWDPASLQDYRPFDGQDCSEDAFDTEYYDNLGPAAKYMSYNKGNRRTRDAAKAGKLLSSCQAKPDGDCLKRCEDSENKSQCESGCHRGGVETWWGLCHAWTPAAILEPTPLHPVTYNDVTFEVGDIKALLQTIYDRSSASLIGGRCNDWEIEREDDTGRIKNPDCRDLNAGSFHVSVVNLLGVQKRGFVEDKTTGYQVWNQPVWKYEVTQSEEISIPDAHTLLKVTGEDDSVFVYNDAADKLYHVKLTLHWLTESHASTEAVDYLDYSKRSYYEYIVEVDADGDVMGGEWANSSVADHPDFIWLPFRARGGNPNVDIRKVKFLNEQSQTEQGGDEPTGDLMTHESGAVGIAIPDKDLAGITHFINVGDDVTVTGGKVSVDITHTYIGDLVVALTAPGGQSWTLSDKEGGSTNDLKRSFPLDGLSGSILGNWTLTVADTYAQDTGNLESWRLDFQVGEGGGGGAADSVDTFTGGSAAIPDNRASGVTSTLDVDASGAVKGLEVKVAITHTYRSDLQVILKKDGVSKTLHNREGGSADDLTKTWHVDEFNGQGASGRWSLVVKDLAKLDTGKLNSWSLKITH